MAAPVNLNRYRKAKARANAKARADENAVKFGQPKALSKLAKVQQDQAEQRLDGHRLNDAEKP
jgi:hypothetical protein